MLLIVECLKWVMHVRHENHCVSEIGLLCAPFVASVEVNPFVVGLNMQPVEIYEISFLIFFGMRSILLGWMTLPMGFKAGWIHHLLHSFVSSTH